jgi:hypothetical protein
MKLKKPKVKLRKTVKPRSTQRIVTKVKRASMPDIQLPEMSGLTDGLGGEMGGFDLMPDLDEISIFGSSQSIGNDLVGTYYDTKRDRRGKSIACSADEYQRIAHKFMRAGWKTSVLSRYFRSPKKLYSQGIVIPETMATIAPLSFADEGGVGALWLVHYKGQLVHNERIRFRFYGACNEFMIVRVDGKIVLGGCWNDDRRGVVIGNLWETSDINSDQWYWGRGSVQIGDWITLEPGVPLDMEVLLGDNGASTSFMLAVEVDGVEYERSAQGAPILPAFKTADFSRDHLDLVYQKLPEGEVCLTSGPVFNDFSSRSDKAGTSGPEKMIANEASVSVEPSPESALRHWTLLDGRTFEAEFVTTMGADYVLRSPRGKQLKISTSDFSAGDRLFAELARPPRLEVDFIKNLETVTFSEGWYGTYPREPEQHGNFGLRVKQTSSGAYQHELKAELFVVGQQIGVPDRQCFILDRQEFSFQFSEENKRVYEFMSERQVRLENWGFAYSDSKAVERGELYYGYLVVITDSRGEIVAVQSSKTWLKENFENLRKLRVGNFFDRKCIRSFPGRPVPLRWG